MFGTTLCVVFKKSKIATLVAEGNSTLYKTASVADFVMSDEQQSETCDCSIRVVYCTVASAFECIKQKINSHRIQGYHCACDI